MVTEIVLQTEIKVRLTEMPIQTDIMEVAVLEVEQVAEMEQETVRAMEPEMAQGLVAEMEVVAQVVPIIVFPDEEP